MSIPLIIFAKAPKPGVVKTRLIPALGAEGAACLYERLLEHTIQQAVSSACFPVYIYTPDGLDHPFIQKMLTQYSLIHRHQQGADLGDRMYTALSDFSECTYGALLIGSDCPAINVDMLERCSHALETHNAVFLPAEDGGYTLVGLKQTDVDLREPAVHIPYNCLFDGIEWSTDQVMQQTRERLKQLSISWAEPAVLWDVDQPEDLNRLAQQFPELFYVIKLC
jgi:rSAM/selenodomain-associated transferase 1